MRWITEFLTSSIGKKLVMSLTGLFLISFLIVHLLGNLQLLISDNGKSFNIYAHFMSTNPLIKVISIGLYAGILLHAIQGILIALQNKKAKGSKYAVNTNANGSWISKNMALLGTFILFFLCVHMGDFWYKVKFTDTLEMITYPGVDYQVKDVFKRVAVAFENIWIVIIYLVGLVALGLHLIHGFQSAFTSLGLQHKKYTPIINIIGILFSVGISLAYAVIPLIMYFSKLSNY
ncbi:succinate dehydrogenase cytochrome b subunit [bacterium]|nr:succinate dehydrogenase cytochrome b subunit [bacterium]